MAELGEFGLIILVVATGVMLALVAAKIAERYPIPAPALFLLVALAIPVAIPHIKTVERIGVVALIVILFDGGMHIGWRRFRRAIVPIGVLGVVGTLTTAVLIAICAHFLLDFSWTLAGVVAAALAPTDPAVMFSILGDKEIGGHSGTILEGEAGVNDPVGIALMIGMLEYATSDSGSVFSVVKEFTLEMAIGARRRRSRERRCSSSSCATCSFRAKGCTRCGRSPRPGSSTGSRPSSTGPVSSPSSSPVSR